MNSDETDPDDKDWRGNGYFRCPAPAAGQRPPKDPLENPWLWWQMACHQAKSGRFELLPGLVKVCVDGDDMDLEYVSANLLGDAGTPDCFSAIRSALRVSTNTETRINLCVALGLRGCLADVPVLADSLDDMAGLEGTPVIGSDISTLLGDGEPELILDPVDDPDYPACRDAVMKRYRELTEQFGSDQIYVLHGKRFGVVSLAERMLSRLRQKGLPAHLGQRFAAATGIDCSPWYKNGRLVPLVAAAAVEEFLEGPDAANYADGARYFFGHRIPG